MRSVGLSSAAGKMGPLLVVWVLWTFSLNSDTLSSFGCCLRVQGQVGFLCQLKGRKEVLLLDLGEPSYTTQEIRVPSRGS